MSKRRLWIAMLLLGVIFGVVSCGDEDNDLAPNSIGGQNYRFTITSGTGASPTSGTMLISFTANGAYTLTDLANNMLDMGTYTYTKIDKYTGQSTLTSVGGTVATCILAFTAEDTGNFSITAPTGSARGIFSRI
jgi:hypothetical protein